MNKLGLAFSTCDRTELTVQSIEPLRQPDKFSTYVFDGSKTQKGLKFFESLHDTDVKTIGNVGGGSAAAVVCALSWLLDEGQDYVGLVENDVLLPSDWYEPTMALFAQGEQDGLQVGAVTARTYEDRILIQRDGYAILHNAGFGMQIYTREAAELVLQTLRSHMSMENRKVFALLTGKDIGAYWAFRGHDISLMADWGVDRILAQHGLASLGLTPSRVEMIGQVPALAEQGLTIASAPVEGLRSDPTFYRYRDQLALIRNGSLDLNACAAWYQDPNSGQWHIYPHQLERVGGRYFGEWHLQSNLGFGTFSWVAGEPGLTHAESPSLEVSILGACDILVSGGAVGGSVEVEDDNGYTCSPKLPPQGDGVIMQISVPAAVSYRNIRLTAKNPGVIFYGFLCRERQPRVSGVRFTYESLPKP